MTSLNNDQTSFFKPADRISSFKPYFFASLAKKIAFLQSNGSDVIRIDMGSPDLPPEKFIVDSLLKAAQLPNMHGYSANGNGPAFRKAVALYYKNRFNVDLDPLTETIGLIGSKEGLFHLAQVLINPGDVVLVPDPGYPVYAAGAQIAGGEVYRMPLTKENNFLPDLTSIPEEITRRAKLLWINYPNNPTGAIATKEFFAEVLEFGKEHEIFIAHDAPYVDVCFDGYTAPSILEISGAKEIAIEFNSLSKAYNMAGWRLGMAVGQPDLIRYINTYKSQMDSSHFLPMLEAGITALTGNQEWIQDRNKVYKERRNLLIEGLRPLGFEIDTPPAAIYIWAKLPKGKQDSIAYCDRMLTEIGVSTTPGVVYGVHGEGYLRISLGTDTKRIREAIDRIRNWENK
jgi:LL-diaminopimelate aminotransferase